MAKSTKPPASASGTKKKELEKPVPLDQLDHFMEIGDSGLRRSGGRLSEEFLQQLQGTKAAKLYREMADNHPIIGAMLFAMKNLALQATWEVEACDDSKAAKDVADLVATSMDDMTCTWRDVVADALTMLDHGWSLCETVYRKREGNYIDGGSRYDDGKIGWSKIALRSQDTLLEWGFNEAGEPLLMKQQPMTGGVRTIPLTKALLFRTTGSKNNPEGRSVLRNCVVPYLRQRRIEELESIGIERDLAGLPVIKAPGRLTSDNATPNEKAVLAGLKDILKNIRRDEQEGIILPSDVDERGNPVFSLSLMTSGGQRQFDTTGIVKRYDERMMMSVLADFILLGHGRTGSWALSSDKTELFSVALGSFLDEIAEVFNRQAIPRLLALNGIDLELMPKLKHGDVEKADLQQLVAYVTGLAGAGMPMFPDPDLESFLRREGGLPEAATQAIGANAQAGAINDPEEPVAEPGAGEEPEEPGDPEEPDDPEEIAAIMKASLWDEDEHPRDDRGRFASGSGSAKGGLSVADVAMRAAVAHKPTPTSVAQTVQHLSKPAKEHTLNNAREMLRRAESRYAALQHKDPHDISRSHKTQRDIIRSLKIHVAGYQAALSGGKK